MISGVVKNILLSPRLICEKGSFFESGAYRKMRETEKNVGTWSRSLPLSLPLFQMKNCMFFANRALLPKTRSHLCSGCDWCTKQCTANRTLLTLLLANSETSSNCYGHTAKYLMAKKHQKILLLPARYFLSTRNRAILSSLPLLLLFWRRRISTSSVCGSWKR